MPSIKKTRIKVGKMKEKSMNKMEHSQHLDICGIIQFAAVSIFWFFFKFAPFLILRKK